ARLPGGEREWHLTPLFDNQEYDARAAAGPVYWEGAVRTDTGSGYLEMTGYFHPLNMWSITPACLRQCTTDTAPANRPSRPTTQPGRAVSCGISCLSVVYAEASSGGRIVYAAA